MRQPRWTATLRCGHEAPTQGEPRPGNWMSCITAGCWRQERIESVRPFLAAAPVPRIVPAGVQGTLWDEEAA